MATASRKPTLIERYDYIAMDDNGGKVRHRRIIGIVSLAQQVNNIAKTEDAVGHIEAGHKGRTLKAQFKIYRCIIGCKIITLCLTILAHRDRIWPVPESARR